MFLVRFTEEYEPGEEVHFILQATSLAGRNLVTTDFDINLNHAEPCRANMFEFKKSLSVEELRAEWETHCSEAMKRFVDLFPGPHVELKTMLGWIDKFKNRKF